MNPFQKDWNEQKEEKQVTKIEPGTKLGELYGIPVVATDKIVDNSVCREQIEAEIKSGFRNADGSLKQYSYDGPKEIPPRTRKGPGYSFEASETELVGGCPTEVGGFDCDKVPEWSDEDCEKSCDDGDYPEGVEEVYVLDPLTQVSLETKIHILKDCNCATKNEVRKLLGLEETTEDWGKWLVNTEVEY